MEVEEFGPQATPDGDFPNVPDHVSNPENAAVFDAIIERARSVGADLALATDPDCDRIGFAAPVTLDSSGPWETFTGNQIVALLGEFILSRRQAAGQLSSDHYVVTTLVTTRLLKRIAQAYGVGFYGDLLVGFKWIADTIDQHDPSLFAFGAEESHGYLVGEYARDKDGPVAAMLAAEMAAECKAAGITYAPAIGKPVWPLRLPCRENDLGLQARRNGHGRDAGGHGSIPRAAACGPRRHAGDRHP